MTMTKNKKPKGEKTQKNPKISNIKRSLGNLSSDGPSRRSKIKYLAIAVIIVVVVATIAVLAYQSTQKQTQQPGLKGTIVISGADALYPMVVNWSETYHQLNPGVTFQVSAGGAGVGMTDALSGLSNIGMISRSITQTEVSKGAYYVAVTDNAVIGIVNSHNPVINSILTNGLTRQTLYNIFIAGNVTTWGQAVGTSNKTPIDVYTRSDSSGAASTWATFLGSKTQANLIGTGVLQDTGVLQAVKGDANGIGYNNLAYPYNPTTGQQVSGIAVIPLNSNGNGALSSSENFYGSLSQLIAAIQKGEYPVTTDLYFVTLHSFTGVTESFTQWVLTDGQKYVQPCGFVPLTQDVVNQQLQKLKGSN